MSRYKLTPHKKSVGRILPYWWIMLSTRIVQCNLISSCLLRKLTQWYNNSSEVTWLTTSSNGKKLNTRTPSCERWWLWLLPHSAKAVSVVHDVLNHLEIVDVPLQAHSTQEIGRSYFTLLMNYVIHTHCSMKLNIILPSRNDTIIAAKLHDSQQVAMARSSTRVLHHAKDGDCGCFHIQPKLSAWCMTF